MPRISRRSIDAIYSADNLVNIIGTVVKLKNSGATLSGKSPFKSERTASFMLNPRKKVWKCFSTGIGGSNSIQFLMELEGLSYPEAIKKAAGILGITIEYEGGDSGSSQNLEYKRKKELADRLEQTAIYFGESLKEGSPASKFLLKAFSERLNDEVIEDFQIGFAKKGFLQELKADGTISATKGTGILKAFENRLIFPIHNSWGQVVGFGARIIPNDPKPTPGKYINSPETILYKKKESLYNLNRARRTIIKEDNTFLVEGYFDVIAMHKAGIHNVAAPCGTALTEKQIGLLKPLGRSITICFDGDKEGQKATARALLLCLEAGLMPKVVALEGQDPEDFLSDKEQEKKQEAINNLTVSWLEWLWGFIKKSSNTWQTQDRIEAVQKIQKEYLAKIENQLLREELLLDLEKASGIPIESLQGEDFWEKSTWLNFIALCDRLKISRENEDFAPGEENTISIYRRNLKGKITHSRKTSDQVVSYGVYQPQKLRKAKTLGQILFPGQYREDSLFMVVDEVLAYVLTELGVPSIGISHIAGWKTAPDGKKLHPSLKAALAGYRELIFLVPSQLWEIAEGEEDSSSVMSESEEGIFGLITALQESELEVNLKLLFPRKPTARTQSRFVEKKLLEWYQAVTDPKGRLIRNLDLSRDQKSQVFTLRTVGYNSQKSIRDWLGIDSPDDWREIHQLTSDFVFRGTQYKISPTTGDISIAKTKNEISSLWEENGMYHIKKGARNSESISNFTFIDWRLKITDGVDQKGMFLFRRFDRRDKFRILISSEDWLSPKSLIKKFQAYPKANLSFKGSGQDLLAVYHLLTKKNPKEAEQVNKAGWDSSRNIWIWGGGGYTTLEGKFHPVDSEGTADWEGTKLFWPGVSKLIPKKEREKYKAMSIMEHRGKADVNFSSWVERFSSVYEKGLTGIIFLLGTINVHIIEKKLRKYPVLLLTAPNKFGKSEWVESLGAIAPVMTLNHGSGATNASTREHLSAYNSWFTVYNELTAKKAEFIQSLIKAAYDRQAPAKMDAKTSFSTIDYQKPTGSMIGIAQDRELLFKREEVGERGIHVELTIAPKDRSREEKRNYHSLKALEDKGLGHLMGELLPHTRNVEPNFRERFLEVKECLLDLAPVGINERILESWAMMLTPTFAMIESGLDFPYTSEELYQYAIAETAAQSGAMGKGGIAEIFFDWLSLATNRSGVNVIGAVGAYVDTTKFPQYKDGTLHISLKNVYPLFREYLRKVFPEIQNVSKNDLQRRKLRAHPAFLEKESRENGVCIGYKTEISTNGRIIVKNGQRGPMKVTGRALVFDLSKIDAAINIQYAFINDDEA